MKSPPAPRAAVADGPAAAPASLGVLITITFLGSLSSGAFFAGLYFVTAARYHFGVERNLVLGIGVGVLSVTGSLLAGPITRRARSPRRVLRSALVTWGAVAILPVAAAGNEPLLWVAALVGVGASAVVWPIVESYLTAGRHGATMRFALGVFNVMWSLATALSLLSMPLLAPLGVTASLGVAALFNGGAAWLAGRLAPYPGHHEEAAASAAIGAEYPFLMRSASWLLPASYIISSTLAPVLPHRLEEVLGARRGAGAVAATWMLARCSALFVMWRLRFWHGRWGTLALGAGGLLGGLALVLLAPGAGGLVAGLLVYGWGMGVTYSAAVYYTLSVGRAAVDAGGNFEALIGLGYCGGPLLGLAGQLSGSTGHTGASTVALMWLAAALASPGALRPYWQARRARRR